MSHCIQKKYPNRVFCPLPSLVCEWQVMWVLMKSEVIHQPRKISTAAYMILYSFDLILFINSLRYHTGFIMLLGKIGTEVPYCWSEPFGKNWFIHYADPLKIPHVNLQVVHFQSCHPDGISAQYSILNPIILTNFSFHVK